MPKAIVVNPERCLACKSCMIACAMAHGEAPTLAEAVQSGQVLRPGVHVVAAADGPVALQCRHCEDAPCIAVCPTGAIHRLGDDGPVVLDDDRCIGCKFCVLVCPFGAIDLSPDGKVLTKCDLCIERTRVGEEPACVAACPTCGLEFVEIASWPRRRRREAAARIAAARAEGDDDSSP